MIILPVALFSMMILSKAMEPVDDHSSAALVITNIQPLVTSPFESSLARVAIKLHEMKTSLKSHKDKPMDIDAYNAAKNAIGSEVMYLEGSKFSEMEKTLIQKSLVRIPHELHCLDRILACTIIGECNDAEFRLRYCLRYSFEEFSGKINRLYDRTETLAREFSDMAALVTVSETEKLRSKLTTGCKHLRTILKVGIASWSNEIDLTKLQKKIAIITYHLANMDHFMREISPRLAAYHDPKSNKTILNHAIIDPGETLSSSSINLVLANIEESIVEFMNPFSSIINDLPERIKAQSLRFEEAMKFLTSQGIREVNLHQPQIIKISYLLSMLNK
ncbi:hypothetical protein JCM33374_g4468 [Metschnikowia sp. JCM 33374]|nr:hypothetical protein JCM33374_g4468 [Metschnikowia sp. JCM 33374]